MRVMKLRATVLSLTLALLLGGGVSDLPDVPHFETAPHTLRDCAGASTGSGAAGHLTLDLSDSLDSWADQVDASLVAA